MPAFQDVKEVMIDGEMYGVSIAWGSLGLIYDVDVHGEIDSWDAMWDPANSGKMIVLDDTNNNIVNAAIYLGMDNPYNLSEAEMEEVKQNDIEKGVLKEINAKINDYNNQLSAFTIKVDDFNFHYQNQIIILRESVLKEIIILIENI